VRWPHAVGLVAALVLAAGAFLFLLHANAVRDDAARDRVRETAALASQRKSTRDESDRWTAQVSETELSLTDMRAAVATGQQLVGIADELVDNARSAQQAGAAGDLDTLKVLVDRRNELISQSTPLIDAWFYDMLKVNRPEYRD
jgi:hypothetical protein